MFGNGRKTIGVFVPRIYNEFQISICRGICKQAKELGYNVAFFSKFTENSETMFGYGERMIAELPDYKLLEGVILITNSILKNKLNEKVKAHIDGEENCPIVYVKKVMEGHYNVNIDDEKILEEVIRHFIDHHGYKKINFLSGPKGYPDADKRVDSFCRIMNKYGLGVNEKQIYYGDFWKHKAYDAAVEWMHNHEDRPEAIICANDYMAITLCNALNKMGYDVPGDVAVSGCDNIEQSQDFIPSITTVGQPLFRMGVEAVNKIYNHKNNIDQEETTYLESKTYIRESCGCKVDYDPKKIAEKRNRILLELEEKEKDIAESSQWSIDLTGITKTEDLYEKMSNHPYLADGQPSYFMCLFNNWDLPMDKDLGQELDKGLRTMVVGKKDGKSLDKVVFDRRQILPAGYMDDEPQFYIFNMLHHQEKCFGYTAINFFEPRAFKSSYQGWAINVSNALENIRVHGRISRLLYSLEDLHVRDVMTGIYNRRGLSIANEYLKQCLERQVNILVISLDIDNLKEINDNFGHASGDNAIKVVAKALENASEDDEICIRMGGDEFSVIGMEYNTDKLNIFINKMSRYIEDENRTGSNNYKINISYGYHMDIPKQDTSLEEYINIADGKMYEQKSNKGTRSRRDKE